MMQTLTKTELAWIYEAMEQKAKRNVEAMGKFEEGSPMYHLAELGRDNAVSVMKKINAVLNDKAKRIRIEQ